MKTYTIAVLLASFVAALSLVASVQVERSQARADADEASVLERLYIPSGPIATENDRG